MDLTTKANITGNFRIIVSDDSDLKNINFDSNFFKGCFTFGGLHKIGEVDSDEEKTYFGNFVLGDGNQEIDRYVDSLKNQKFISDGFIKENVSIDKGFFEITIKYQFEKNEINGLITEIGLKGDDGVLFNIQKIKFQGENYNLSIGNNKIVTCFFKFKIEFPLVDTKLKKNIVRNGKLIPTDITMRPIGIGVYDNWKLKGFTDEPIILMEDSFKRKENPSDNFIEELEVRKIEYDRENNPFRFYVEGILPKNKGNGKLIKSIYSKSLFGFWNIIFEPSLEKKNNEILKFKIGCAWGEYGEYVPPIASEDSNNSMTHFLEPTIMAFDESEYMHYDWEHFYNNESINESMTHFLEPTINFYNESEETFWEN